MSWADLVASVSPYLLGGKRCRPPLLPKTILRIHYLQQWFALSDPSMEEALHDMPVFREFAGLEGWDERLPDESTILRFRHVLEKHKLAYLWLVGRILMVAVARVHPQFGKSAMPRPNSESMACELGRIRLGQHYIPIGSAHQHAIACVAQTFLSQVRLRHMRLGVFELAAADVARPEPINLGQFVLDFEV